MPDITPRLPEHLTFTGVGDHVNIDEMAAYSLLYPIEWGVLISLSQTGFHPRYPTPSKIQQMLDRDLPLSLHICGGLARQTNQGGVSTLFDLDVTQFRRIQINHLDPNVALIAEFSQKYGVRCIAQCRADTFPETSGVDWLFDRSGGRGVVADTLPPYPHRELVVPHGAMVGYAGGIGPDNILSHIQRINASGPYWIDMESSVCPNDRFDLHLCEKAAARVYGSSMGADYTEIL